MSFHRNKGTELGLIPATKALLANPPMPFEFDKHDRICAENYTKKRSYAQEYYLRVLKPKQEAERAANPKPDRRKYNGRGSRGGYGDRKVIQLNR